MEERAGSNARDERWIGRGARGEAATRTSPGASQVSREVTHEALALGQWPAMGSSGSIGHLSGWIPGSTVTPYLNCHRGHSYLWLFFRQQFDRPSG